MIAAGMVIGNKKEVKMAKGRKGFAPYAVRIITVSMGGPLLVYKLSVSAYLEMVPEDKRNRHVSVSPVWRGIVIWNLGIGSSG